MKPVVRLPLPALLSQVFVAFTIEADNAFERQMVHRTSSHGAPAGSRGAPWLVSLAMWSTCLRFVSEAGVTVGELERLAGVATNLAGMARWGYIVVAPDPADPRPKPPHSGWVIRATSAGRRARAVWDPLVGEIERRWRDRFGAAAIDQLRDSLWAVARQFDVPLPACLPILKYGLTNADGLRLNQRALAQSDDDAGSHLPLFALVSRVLLAFALHYERESPLSLAIGADVLRLVGPDGIRVRDLPRVSGVSKEAISMALGFLGKRGYVVVEPAPDAGRGQAVRLTAKGREAREDYWERVDEIERRWRPRFGGETLSQLRTSLERLVGEPTAASPLMEGLKPFPDGWRAAARPIESLPHYPMVLHRGGFPDGV